ncbi:hypothetical protein Y032_0108g61 [Ancylostoma ceylanicum]|uniref:Uncharacterized protein n=1 Tax=Ancylostoma ceylanicum TaxID=53326 RepID=A0A016TFG6_9BILA|nr:hypothetical protein Y032_0108g61 [Ancylostoma ceylanicum]
MSAKKNDVDEFSEHFRGLYISIGTYVLHRVAAAESLRDRLSPFNWCMLSRIPRSCPPRFCSQGICLGFRGLRSL